MAKAKTTRRRAKKSSSARKSKNGLPPYVTRTATRHGTPILQFNRPGFPKYTFQAEPGSTDFMIEYLARFRGLTVRTVSDDIFEHFEPMAATLLKLPFGYFAAADSLVIMRRMLWQELQAARPDIGAIFKRVEHTTDRPSRRQP